MAYAIKMSYKTATTADTNGIQDFSVYPLEGVWDLKHGGKLVKEEAIYKRSWVGAHGKLP